MCDYLSVFLSGFVCMCVWVCVCVSVGEYLSGYLVVIVFEWEKMRASVNECLYIYMFG